jgi:hypothetical protein
MISASLPARLSRFKPERSRAQVGIGCLIALMAVYLMIAGWLKITYVSPFESKAEPAVAGQKFLLRRPFVRFLGSDFSVSVPDERFAELADTVDNDYRSNIEIYEDGRKLGPAHSVHADVAKIGHGLFSHWRFNSAIFLFSSSDNSDPQTNGRAYWVVKPDASASVH